MNKLLSILIVFIFCISTSKAADVCKNSGYVFVLFNGVNTTRTDALMALKEMKSLYGTTRSGENISYEILYNTSDGLIPDVIETFEQRLGEQGDLLKERYELFFEAINSGGKWWERIIAVVPEAAQTLNSLEDYFQALIASGFSTLNTDPPTMEDYAKHRTRIDNWVLEGKKLLFVAHSQGNLFMNSAYEFTSSKADAGSYKAVHIAPASPQTNGSHTLADKDLVINRLNIVGSTPSITDVIDSYVIRPAGLNGKKDILGHGLLEIYLNPSLSTSNRIAGHINNALDSLVTPTAEASSGFFTTTLTWNGSGDVDLHTYEPDGSHVYYSNKSGSVGYLDVDNTSANGPEHYFASCDSDVIQTGNYSVAIANFNNAEGRIATVQVSSSAEGVLGTKSVTLGGATGDNAVYPMFTVNVSKDNETNELSVSIGQ